MADSAVRLVTLQALSQLGGGGGGGRRGGGGHDSFEDYACGVIGGGGGVAGDGDPGGEGGGFPHGYAPVMKGQTAISREPGSWVEACSGFLRRELGAVELGAGWSAAALGRRRVDWSGRTVFEYSYVMMAEVHHPLVQTRNVPQAEASVCPSLQAIELTCLDRGD